MAIYFQIPLLWRYIYVCMFFIKLRAMHTHIYMVVVWHTLLLFHFDQLICVFSSAFQEVFCYDDFLYFIWDVRVYVYMTSLRHRKCCTFISKQEN